MAANILDTLIRKTSVTLNIKEGWVDKVITHQWKSGFEAVHKVKQIEFSGLGKFIVSPARARRKLSILNKTWDFINNKKEKLERLPMIEVDQEFIKRKLDV